MSRLSRDFLLRTFSIMIVGWGICVCFSLSGVSLNENYLLYVPYLLGGWSPTIASFFALKKNGGITNIKEWLKNIFDFRQTFISYCIVVLLAVVFILPQCLISGHENGAPLFAIFVMIPMMIVGGGLEEAGWRYILQPELEKKFPFTVSTLIVSIIWWLWHNAFPSNVLMGDAGSRALGFFIGACVLVSGNPFILLATSSVMLMNGGTGLIKVALLRFFKIKIFANVRFPLHDHVRKNLNWSPTQVLLRFLILQLLITIFTLGIFFKIR